MGGGGSSGERVAWEAASLVCRIATAGMSLGSAIMTAASTQCVLRDDGSSAGTVSYSDYGSFKYSALADLLSAVLQMVTIFLEVVGKEKWASTVELIDRLVQALTSTSAALLLAVDDITSCGPPRGRRSGACRSGQTRGFCGRVRVSAALSLAAAVTVSACIYTNRLAATVTQAPAPEEKKKESIYTYRLAPTVTLTPARKEKEAEEKKKKEEEGKGEEKRKKKDEEER